MLGRQFDRIEPILRGGPFMGLVERRRDLMRTTFALGVWATVNLFISAAVLFVFDEPRAGLLALVGAILYSIVIPVFLRMGNIVGSAKWVLSVSYMTNVGMHLVLGGYANSGAYMAWGVLVCTYAVISQPRWFVIGLTGLYVATGILLVPFEGVLAAGRDAPHSFVPAFLAANVFIVSVLMLTFALRQLLELLRAERERSESLLLNVLPTSIASRLKTDDGVIADTYPECTVLFADIAGFTQHSRQVSAQELVAQLNEVFSMFDDLADAAGVEKIKTIGDGYLAVAGVPVPRRDHLEAVCELGLEMVRASDELAARTGSGLRIRVGINTGPVVAGVIGTSRFSFDLWGETVNLASRLESNGVVGEVQVSRAVVDAAGNEFAFKEAGVKDLKGEGPVELFLLSGRLP